MCCGSGFCCERCELRARERLMQLSIAPRRPCRVRKRFAVTTGAWERAAFWRASGVSAAGRRSGAIEGPVASGSP